MRAVITLSLSNRIVEYDSIGSIIPSNSNTIYGVGLSDGARFIIVGVMVEIANGEEFKPGL